MTTIYGGYQPYNMRSMQINPYMDAETLMLMQMIGDAPSFKSKPNYDYYTGPKDFKPGLRPMNEEKSNGLTLTAIGVGLTGLAAGIYGLRKGKFDGLINAVKGTGFYKNHLAGGKISGGIKKGADYVKNFANDGKTGGKPAEYYNSAKSWISKNYNAGKDWIVGLFKKPETTIKFDESQLANNSLNTTVGSNPHVFNFG